MSADEVVPVENEPLPEEAPEAVEARKQKLKAEFLAQGYEEHELHWYPPTKDGEFSPAALARSGLPEGQRRSPVWARFDAQDRAGHWKPDGAAALRVRGPYRGGHLFGTKEMETDP